MELNTFKCGTSYFSDAQTTYYVNDVFTEGIHWKNCYGNPCLSITWGDVSDSGYKVPCAGLYRIKIDATTFTSHSTNPLLPLEVDIDCYTLYDKFSWSMNSSAVITTPETPIAQSDIIPGLNITLNPFYSLNLNDEFHVLIGGIYSEPEDRYVQWLNFGDLSSSGPVSDTIGLIIENNSGVTLTDIEARVVNKICVHQDDTDVPFEATTQISTLNPRFDEILVLSTDYHAITFAVGATANILVDDFGYDVYSVATDTLYPKGEGLTFNGTTQYKLADGSPWPGFMFVLSSALTDTDGAGIYVTNGSDVFDIKLSTDSVWVGEGGKVELSDSMDDGDTVTLSIRANPHLDVVNPEDYPVEGLLQIVGWYGTTQYLTSIPLSAVIKNRIPGVTARASIIDDTTAAVLATFGITEVVLTEIS